MNYSYSSGIAPTLLESYLQRRALENVEPELGYLTDAQMIDQPMNSGSKHVKFFRYTELPAITTPLAEGVTPDPQNLSETAFSVMTKQYGGYMDYTDEIDLWHVDKKTQAMSDRLNRQAALTIDTVGRDAICAGMNVMFPGAITARGSIAGTDLINYTMVKKAVRNLKKKGAQPFADGFFHSKISHETYFDLSGDSHWIAVAQYQNDTRVQRYELGTIYKVKFFEVDNAKVFDTESYLYGTTEKLLMANVAYDSTNRIMTIKETMTEDVARQLTGKLVYVKVSTSLTLMCIERIWPSGSANTTKIQFRWQPAASVYSNWTYNATDASNTQIIPTGGGNSVPVHATIIYGQNAFGCVKLGGKGKPNIRIIVKPLGSAGTSDPLNISGACRSNAA